MISNHYQLPDNEFVRQFEACTLEPSWFTHEAHLRLAWIYIRRLGVEEAAGQLCRSIRRFDLTFGDGRKFHKTVTIAAARAVHHFIQKGSADNFRDLLTEFPALKNQFRELISSHYSFDVFNSGTAKTKYVQPDLQPF